MIEEALSGTTPQVQNSTLTQAKALVATERASAAKKNTSSAGNTAAGSTSKNGRLISHLLIGFAMTVIAVAGYTFLGPHTHVNAAEPAGNNIVNVSTNVPVQTMEMFNMDIANHVHELAVMQAEMDAITQQMNALQNGSMLLNTTSNTTASPVTNLHLSNGSGTSLDQAASQLDQMMLTMHQMLDQVNSLNQQGGASTTVNGSGHGHH